MLKVFISYSHNKLDKPLLDALIKHLAPMWQGDDPLIKCWDDSHINAGDDWDEEIMERLYEADIVLLLVSADFNASKYIWEKEMKEAIERHKWGKCKVVPIWLRDCDFKGMPYEQLKLEMLPKTPVDGEPVPVTSWENQDEAFRIITGRIRVLIENLKTARTKHAADPSKKAGQPLFKDPWHRFFHQKFKDECKRLPLLQTVNCDRFVPYGNELRDHFNANQDKQENLAYLISACPTQKPESLSRRLIYRQIEDAQPGEDPFTFYWADQDGSEEVHFPGLTFGTTEHRTWQNFVRIFEQRFLSGMDFKQFMDAPETTLANHHRVALTFRVERENWDEYEVAEHTNFIIQKFQELSPSCRKFVFFFIFTFPDLHEGIDNECAYWLSRLSHLENTQHAIARKIQKLEPVKIIDVKNWATGKIQSNHLDALLDQLKQEIPGSKRDRYAEQKLFDMEQVEAMQYAAYTYFRDHQFS
jgi:hypothetical protein